MSADADSAAPVPARTPRPRPAERAPWALTGAALLATAALPALRAEAQSAGPARREESANAATGGTPSRDATARDTTTRRFAIPAGPLDAALAGYTRATGLTVADPQGLAGRRTSPGVDGTFTDAEALTRLLGGTGLAGRATGARSLRLEIAGVARPGATLAEVRVTGERARAVPNVSSPKYTEPLRDVPQVVNVVPREVIEQQGATSLRDVVRNVPGLTVNAGEGGATPGDNFNVRGFSARNDIFVNGVRDVGGYTRDAFDLEQVEVAKGPGSVYMGRGSTGGAINLVTKTPQPTRRAALDAGAGTADYGRATLDVNQPLTGTDAALPGVGVRLNAVYQNAGVADLDVVKNKTRGIAPSLAFGMGTSTPVTLEYVDVAQDNTPSYGLQSTTGTPPAQVNTHDFFGLKGLDFERVRANTARARVSHQFSPHVRFDDQLARNADDVQRIVTTAALDGTRTAKSHATSDATMANQATLATDFTTGGVTHALVAGLDVTRERSRFGSFRFSSALPTITDITNPDPNDVFTGTVTRAPDRRRAVANTQGAYLFETAKPGEHWELTAGLRYDNFDPQYTDSLGAPMASTRSHAVTWRTGVVYKPVRAASVYAAYGTSFNPTGELLAYDSQGQLDLPPERSKTAEVGAKWDVSHERLALTASLFRTEKTNARMTDPSDPLGTTVILSGLQRVGGAELGAQGRITQGWTVQAGYTWLDSRIVNGTPAQQGHMLPNAPRNAYTMWTTLLVPSTRLQLGGGARFMSQRWVSGTAYVPSYTAYDAEASYPVTRNVALQLNAINLTNATYYDNGRFWVPAAGRTLRLTTRLNY